MSMSPIVNGPATSGNPFFTESASAVMLRNCRDRNIVQSQIAVSSTEATVADPLANGDWDRRIAMHEAATAFHSSAWARVLTETYPHRPLYLQFSNADKTSALLPLIEVNSPFTGRRGISLPFTDLCPPLSFGGCDEGALVAKLTALAEERKWKYFELRGASFLRETAAPVTTFYGHKLDLTGGPDELQPHFAPNVRRNLRKASESGVTVEITRSREAVLRFYDLLARTRRRHGLPPQSRKFFLKIHEHLLEQDHGFVALGSYQQQPIAGAIFFTFGRNALYKYGASDERLQHVRANNLVMWQAMQTLCERGMRTLHFGRTARDNEGLRRFKLAWGAEEEIVEYFRFERATGRWSTAERDLAGRAGGVFRRLPLAVNRLIGSMVYPHLD